MTQLRAPSTAVKTRPWPPVALVKAWMGAGCGAGQRADEGSTGGQGSAEAGSSKGCGSRHITTKVGMELSSVNYSFAGDTSWLLEGLVYHLISCSVCQMPGICFLMVALQHWSSLRDLVLTHRMDPSSSYLLKIRHLRNPEKARKDATCFYFEKVVYCDTTIFKDFVESIVDQYPSGYKEVPHVQYYDDVLKIYPEVKTDQELMTMFDKYIRTKVVNMFIAYSHPSKLYQPITEWHSDDLSQPMQKEANNSTQLVEDSYLQNPFPKNELVGVDEEVMYLPNDPKNALSVFMHYDKEHDKAYATEDEDKDDVDEESDCEVKDGDDDELAGNDHEAENVPHMDYDKEDPPMTVGSTYLSMEEFKLALSQHAIKHEFEYRTEYSSTRRFGATCARKVQDYCQWRLHASVKENLGTVMVKRDSYDHDCSSTRRKRKVRNATKH